MFGGQTDSVLAHLHDCLGQVGVPVLIELCAKCGAKGLTQCPSLLQIARVGSALAAQHLSSGVSLVTVFWSTDFRWTFQLKWLLPKVVLVKSIGENFGGPHPTACNSFDNGFHMPLMVSGFCFTELINGVPSLGAW